MGRLEGLAAAALTIAAALGARTARANGRYPAAGLIAIDPNDANHVVVRATYGVLTTRDGGGLWNWICEPAVGYGGFEDPMMVITADGSLVAGTFEGLSWSTDGGCAWSFQQGALTNRYVIDLAFEAGATSGVLLVSNSVGANLFSTQVFETKDAGHTWTQAGVDLPSEFLGLTLDVAPSSRQRIYASGRYGKPTYQGAIERSDDRGATWQRFDIPGADDMHLPYIGAIDPHDPDTLYVRIDGDPTDELMASHDGGATWSTVFTSKGNLLGLALSPDGKTLAIGGDTDGILVADTASLSFQSVGSTNVKCLTWTSGGLYACADEFVDHFTVGKSTDGGKTFQPLMHLADLCGPLACDVSSSVGKTCSDVWSVTRDLISARDCGASSSSGSGSDAKGGGCETRGGPSGTLALAMAAGLFAALGGRRRFMRTSR